MRIAYLHCFAGIAGDMFLGALLDAGVPASVLHEATAALNLNATLRLETVDRSGISCTKVHVLEAGELAEGKPPTHTHEPEAGHTHDPSQAHNGSLEQETPTHSHQPKMQHLHKIGHPHTHDHDHKHDDGPAQAHVHGRSLTAIRKLIGAAPLHEAVKSLSIKAFELLGHAEAKIHNVPLEEIHFHEVGAVDAIVDIVATCAGVHHLDIGAWYASPVNVGGGTVPCAHGIFPVPAPATADLLRGVPTYSAHVQKELVTPTGAALLRALAPTFGEQPPMRVEHVGYGAGTRNPKDFPNVLRLSLGESCAPASSPSPQPGVGASSTDASGSNVELVTVLETALDDASPQLLAYVAEQALAAGALDVMLTPVIMKKGRPGTLLTVLCAPEASAAFEQLLLRETPTLGLRIRQDRRVCLERRHVSVETAYGSLRVKVGVARGGEERNAAPEFEDCRTAAQRHNAPLKRVQQAALAAYLDGEKQQS